MLGRPTPHDPSRAEAKNRVVGGWWLSPSGRTAVAAPPAAPGNAARQNSAPRTEARDLFATREIIAASNEALAAAGSPLRLEPGTPEELPGELAGRDLLRVTPVLRRGSRELSGDALLQQSACTEVADTLTGGKSEWHGVFRPPGGGTATIPLEVDTNDTGRAEQFGLLPRLLMTAGPGPDWLVGRMKHDLVRIAFTWSHGGVTVNVDAVEEEGEPGSQDNALFDENASVDSGDTEAEQAVERALRQLADAGMPEPAAAALTGFMAENLDANPALQQEFVHALLANLGARQEPDLSERAMDAALAAVRRKLAAPNADYDGAGAEQRRVIASRFGVNEAAAPETGEVFVIVSSRLQTPEERRPGGDPWNHHLATVVAVDGDARITLENYTRAGVPGADKMWYFAMYGPEHERLFHTVWAPETTAPVTFVLRKRN